MKTHEKVDRSEQLFSCKVCNKTYVNRSNILKHERMAHNKFVCKLCKERFSDKRDFNLHKEFHMKGNKFACEICDKTFISRRNVRRHQRISHKTFTCKNCDEQFSEERDFEAHRQTHEGETQFPCKYCDDEVHHCTAPIMPQLYEMSTEILRRRMRERYLWSGIRRYSGFS